MTLCDSSIFSLVSRFWALFNRGIGRRDTCDTKIIVLKERLKKRGSGRPHGECPYFYCHSVTDALYAALYLGFGRDTKPFLIATRTFNLQHTLKLWT